MIRGSVTVETLPVDVSIPQVFEKATRECKGKDWEKRSPRADTESLEHSPSGCVCGATVEVVMIVVEITVRNWVRVGLEMQPAIGL